MKYLLRVHDVSCSHEMIIFLKRGFKSISVACMILWVTASSVCYEYVLCSVSWIACFFCQFLVFESRMETEAIVWSQQGMRGQAAQQGDKAASLIPTDRLACISLQQRCLSYYISSQHKSGSPPLRIFFRLFFFLIRSCEVSTFSFDSLYIVSLR